MHNNPYLPEDSWKNKTRLESIERIKQQEFEKQQQKVREAVESFIRLINP